MKDTGKAASRSSWSISFKVVALLALCGTVPARAQQNPGSSAAAVGPDRASPAIAQIGSMEVLDDRHKLGDGDKISFRIAEEREPPIVLAVSPSGDVEVPLIGRVPVAGLTCKQAALKIKGELEKKYYRAATVIVGLEATSTASLGVVYVTGQVATQGPLEIPRGETFTVSKAILRAGGFADFANKRRVRILRQRPGASPERIIVDVKAVIEQGKLDKDVIVEPGDYIVVPERGINF